eukprot:CAMPEP_0181481396 /NCGR_PEP_ID=MMETSP1110-20121109/44294_1 /TAXON_ID=174948 /ORGANISM="Symbiodinium sp., Strain CCMP421" /LENGTH=317 /DNA_ID=CAMNT_0023606895 /DNA_START=30 /DNA_END=980 /DNA_ORIENTATION=-
MADLENQGVVQGVVVQGKVIAPLDQPEAGPSNHAHHAHGHHLHHHAHAAHHGQGAKGSPAEAPVPVTFGHGEAAHVRPRHDPLEVVQLSCKDANLPPEIRLNFVKKVYGILGTMLLITFGITTPFIFATAKTLWFFQQNQWILYIVGGLMTAQLVFDFCMFCQLCCGGSGLIRLYYSMMKTAPWNYLYIMTFSSCFGVMTGFLCACYTAQSVLLVFALTFVLVVALTIYAVRTQADFTGWGAYIMVLFLGFGMAVLVYCFFPSSLVWDKIIAGVGATLFGFIIVYDTQLLFGSASVHFRGGKRHIEYTIDMYAFAAW